MTRSGVSGVECVECGSVRTACVGTGYSDEGIRLRRRQCTDCDSPSFLTVEVPVDATWGELDTSYRLKQREYFRRKQGYQGRTKLSRTRQTASLDVRVRVVRHKAVA